jgi:hypothetical protein
MAKFSDLQTGVFGVFSSDSWNALNILTIPQNFVAAPSVTTFIRVGIIPGSPGINRLSVNGVLLIEIFTPANSGPVASMQIADSLDSFLGSNTVSISPKTSVQFFNSTIGTQALDKVNPSLFRMIYSIPFKYYGVL